MSDEEIHARLRKFLIASLVENAGLVGWFTDFSGSPLNTWEYNVVRFYG